MWEKKAQDTTHGRLQRVQGGAGIAGTTMNNNRKTQAKPALKLRSNLKPMLDERGVTIRKFAVRIDYRFESVRQLCNVELDGKRLPVALIEATCQELECDICDLLAFD